MIQPPGSKGTRAGIQSSEPPRDDEPEEHRGQDGQGEHGDTEGDVALQQGVAQGVDALGRVAHAEQPQGLTGQVDAAGDVHLATLVDLGAGHRQQGLRRRAHDGQAPLAGIDHHGVYQVGLAGDQLQHVLKHGGVAVGESRHQGACHEQTLLLRGAHQQLRVALADLVGGVPDQQAHHSHLDGHGTDDDLEREAQAHGQGSVLTGLRYWRARGRMARKGS